MKTSEKIKRIMEYKNLNYRSLGLKVGYSDVQVGNIIKKGLSPKIEFLQNIIRVFSDINPLYFFDENAEMLKNNNVLNEPPLEYKKNNESGLKEKIDLLEKMITLQESYQKVNETLIKKLQKDITELNLENSELKKEIKKIRKSNVGL